MFRSSICLAIVLISSVLAVSAQAWKKLGSKDIDLNNINDTIVIKNKYRSYSKFKLGVSGASVRISRLVFIFSNGERRSFKKSFTVEMGQTTNEVALEGIKASIQRVDLWYESRSLNAKKAKITVYASPSK